MRSLQSCWVALNAASENQVIVSIAAGAFEIWPVGPGSRGEQYLADTPERVIGVYSPTTEYSVLLDDASALEEMR